ncbi:EF-hand domain-containing protein [Longispora albida]|uniref:EF-hand domain-containing protein n=1 Tax=Longispora albida TaxID=203523 RepID=UPI0003A16B04|nr:EF-hand domain-containing protein [Longispora albida]
MPAALLDTKLSRAFGHLDIDGNGVIERDDLLALGSRLLAGFGEPPTSTRGQEVTRTLDAFWNTLLGYMDLDGDGMITPDEFHRGMRGAFVEGSEYEAIFDPAAQSFAVLCDTDHDGEIAEQEFLVMQQAFGTGASEARQAFTRLDRDGDGTVTVAEYLEAVRQFYTGSDEDVPGNWLYGPL